VTGMGVVLPLLVVVGIPSFLAGTADVMGMALVLGSAFVGGVFGVMLGWLAWYGAVEPLPKVTLKQVREAEALVTYPCGICGGAVTQDVKADCRFACGQVFHDGCYRAKESLADAAGCGVCGYTPAT